MPKCDFNIAGNIAKHSGECPQTFPGMLPNILGNVLKYSRECRKTFRGMSQNIPWNVAKYSGEHSSNILRQIQLILAYISILFQK